MQSFTCEVKKKRNFMNSSFKCIFFTFFFWSLNIDNLGPVAGKMEDEKSDDTNLIQLHCSCHLIFFPAGICVCGRVYVSANVDACGRRNGSKWRCKWKCTREKTLKEHAYELEPCCNYYTTTHTPTRTEKIVHLYICFFFSFFVCFTMPSQPLNANKSFCSLFILPFLFWCF